MPQGLDAQMSDAGEVADCEPCCHPAIVNPPLTGQSIAERGLDPPELILTNYFTVRDGKIVSLIVIRNLPPAY
jgi:hypothetical protein